MQLRKRIAAFAFLVFAILIAQPVLASQKTVLVVYSYDPDLAWTRQCDGGIRNALPDDILIERRYMDTKRTTREEYEEKAQEIFLDFLEMHPALVMLSDDNALRLLGPKIAPSGTPVVYFGINGNPRDYFDYLPDNVTGLIERIPLFHWVRMIFDIVPKAQSLLVLMDSSPTADAIMKSAFQKRTSVIFDGKRVDLAETKDWESWKRLALRPEYDVILMPVYHALDDANGKHVSFETVIAWTSKNSRVPVFASQDYAVGDQGVVGAFSIVGEEHGRLAGYMAKNILDGTPTRQLSTADDQQGALYFNRKQLKRFDLILPEHIEKKARYK